MNEIVKQITLLGQSIWYDNIERKLLNDGTLAGMIQRGEIRGITSNPSIFNNAISNSEDYSPDIRSLLARGLGTEAIYERLAINDIQRAADLFSDLYTGSGGEDGYVSLEVSPELAHDTENTIADAHKIWNAVDRPNLMVKIPATLAGLPAITEVIAAGINVNVTLIFGLDRYRAVRDAYLAGLEKRLSQGSEISNIASVASFFISRIDSKLDNYLKTRQETASPQDREIIQSLLGKSALASGKLAFAEYQETFEAGNRFKSLKSRGANRQRVLWASTSTKNPAYPDTIYVDELIGPGTVNTVPPQTLVAFFDHGKVARTIDVDLEAARGVFRDLASVGVDLQALTQELEDEGVKAFAEAFEALLLSLETRIAEFSS